MSARNWRTCPKCLMLEKQRYDAEHKALSEQYGKIPLDEFIKRRDSIAEPWREEDALREDYEIGVCDDGIFFCNYRCYCAHCDFEFLFRQENKQVLPTDQSAEGA